MIQWEFHYRLGIQRHVDCYRPRRLGSSYGPRHSNPSKSFLRPRDMILGTCGVEYISHLHNETDVNILNELFIGEFHGVVLTTSVSETLTWINKIQKFISIDLLTSSEDNDLKFIFDAFKKGK